MTLKGRWECNRCGHPNDPDDTDYSWWKCAGCSTRRWPWLWWVAGGFISLILLIVLIIYLWPNPEKTYAKQCRKYILGVEGEVGEITQREQERMEKLGERSGFSKEKMEQLCLIVKKAILKETEEEYRSQPPGKNEITQEEQEKLILLAKKMGIPIEAPSTARPERVTHPQQPPGSPEKALIQARKLLESGRYKEARDLLSAFPNHPEISSIIEGFDMSLQVEIGLQYQHPGERPSAILSLNSEELAGLILTHRDNYRLFFTANDRNYFYIFQIDTEGKVTRLFPDPVYNLGENPIQTGIRYQIPSKGNDWYYLEELPINQTQIEEAIYLLASRWPARDLDDAYGAIYKAPTKNERDKALAHLKERIRCRKESKLPGVFCQEFVFLHKR